MASTSKKPLNKLEKIKKKNSTVTSLNNQTDAEFPSDWDIDVYRTEYESEEHWLLRRKFMEVHKEKFPESKLVCLAQVFSNVEFLGCKYPAETMRLVGELSQEVAKEFRAERAKKLKRTFVAASDAAEQRAKGRRVTQQQNQRTPNQTTSRYGIGNNRICFNMDGRNEEMGLNNTSKQMRISNESDLFEGLRHGNFVLSLIGGRNCIRLSAQNANMEYRETNQETDNLQKKVEIFLDNKLIAEAVDSNLKSAKEAAFNSALGILKKECFCIKPNPSQPFIKVDKRNNEIVCNIEQEQRLSENNKGFNMMKKMGWTGGGLGSMKQGRENPVEYLFKSSRSGLGASANCVLDKSFYHNMLSNYSNSDDVRELRFEPNFSKDERAWLHEITPKYNLKSRSRGSDSNRCLFVYKKSPSSPEIVKNILLHSDNKYCEKFLLKVPDTKVHLFPDYTQDIELDP